MESQENHLSRLPFEMMFEIFKKLDSRDLKAIRLDTRLNECANVFSINASRDDCYKPDRSNEFPDYNNNEEVLVEWVSRNVIGVWITSNCDVTKFLADYNDEYLSTSGCNPFPNGTLVVSLLGNHEGGDRYADRFPKTENVQLLPGETQETVPENLQRMKYSFLKLRELCEKFEGYIQTLHVLFPSDSNPIDNLLDYQAVFASIYGLSRMSALNLYSIGPWSRLIQRRLNSIALPETEDLFGLNQLVIYGFDGIGVVKKLFATPDFKSRMKTLRLGMSSTLGFILREETGSVCLPTDIFQIYPSLEKLIIHDLTTRQFMYFPLPDDEESVFPLNRLTELSLTSNINTLACFRNLASTLSIVQQCQGRSLKIFNLNCFTSYLKLEDRRAEFCRSICESTLSGKTFPAIKKFILTWKMTQTLAPLVYCLLSLMPNLYEIGFHGDYGQYELAALLDDRQDIENKIRDFVSEHCAMNPQLKIVTIPCLNFYYEL